MQLPHSGERDIYIYRERERHRERQGGGTKERERERLLETRPGLPPWAPLVGGRIWSCGGLRLLCLVPSLCAPSSFFSSPAKLAGLDRRASRIPLSGKRTAALQRFPKALHQEREIECSISLSIFNSLRASHGGKKKTEEHWKAAPQRYIKAVGSMSGVAGRGDPDVELMCVCVCVCVSLQNQNLSLSLSLSLSLYFSMLSLSLSLYTHIEDTYIQKLQHSRRASLFHHLLRKQKHTDTNLSTDEATAVSLSLSLSLSFSLIYRYIQTQT